MLLCLGGVLCGVNWVDKRRQWEEEGGVSRRESDLVCRSWVLKRGTRLLMNAIFLDKSPCSSSN